MNENMPDCITEEHLRLFGAIVHWFARHEVLTDQIIAAASGADATAIKLLTTGLGFTEKRSALFNLLRHRAMPLDEIEQLRAYLVVLETFTPLRNDIAHSEWVEGKPRNSIAPVWLAAGPITAIRPLHDIGESSADYVENEDDIVTYTLDDLKDVVRSLKTNYVGLQAYAIRMAVRTSTVVVQSDRQ